MVEKLYGTKAQNENHKILVKIKRNFNSTYMKFDRQNRLADGGICYMSGKGLKKI